MKEYLSLFLKGICVGIANIIPGVSGGTIALLTGIFEKLIDSIKSFDLVALKLVFKGDLKGFKDHTNLYFLMAVFSGAASGVFVLASIFKYLFVNYPVFIWAFFFGLILASIYFVGIKIKKWNISVLFLFLLSTVFAFYISTGLEPAQENNAVWYLILCGVVAICSMILPGLSGSFVLILMGNYELVMIDAVRNLDFGVLLPLLTGAGVGLVAFSHFLSWLFKNYKDQTISALTGFILGSVPILWPWKEAIIKSFGGVKEKVIGYNWFFPDSFSFEVLFAFGLMLIGFGLIWLLEKLSEKKS